MSINFTDRLIQLMNKVAEKKDYNAVYEDIADKIIVDLLQERFSDEEIKDKLSSMLFEHYETLFRYLTKNYTGHLKEKLDDNSVGYFGEAISEILKDIKEYQANNDIEDFKAVKDIGKKMNQRIIYAVNRNLQEVTSKEGGWGKGIVPSMVSDIGKMTKKMQGEEREKLDAIQSAFKAKDFGHLKDIGIQSPEEATAYLYDKVKNYNMDKRVKLPTRVMDLEGNEKPLDISNVGGGFSWIEVLNGGRIEGSLEEVKQKREELFNKLVNEYSSYFGKGNVPTEQLPNKYYDLLKKVLVKQGVMSETDNFFEEDKLNSHGATIKEYMPPKSAEEFYERLIKPAWLETKGTTSLETQMEEGEESLERSDLPEDVKPESPESYVIRMMEKGSAISQEQLNGLVELLSEYVSNDERSRTSIEMKMDTWKDYIDEANKRLNDPNTDENMKIGLTDKIKQAKSLIIGEGKKYIDTYILEWFRDILKDDFSGRDLTYELVRLNMPVEEAAQQIFYKNFVGGSGKFKWQSILDSLLDYLSSEYGVDKSQLITGASSKDKLIRNAWMKMFEVLGDKLEKIGLPSQMSADWLKTVSKLSNKVLNMQKFAFIKLSFKQRIIRLANVIYAATGYESGVRMVNFIIDINKFVENDRNLRRVNQKDRDDIDTLKGMIQMYLPRSMSDVSISDRMDTNKIIEKVRELFSRGLFIAKLLDPNIQPEDLIRQINNIKQIRKQQEQYSNLQKQEGERL